MLSLVKGGKFPFLTLVSMRGDFGEGNPWQYPMGQAVQPVILCERVQKFFGRFEALKQVDLSVARGEVVCIVGPSGGGKSTLLRTLNGLEPFDGGRIRIGDTELPGSRREVLQVRVEVPGVPGAVPEARVVRSQARWWHRATRTAIRSCPAPSSAP